MFLYFSSENLCVRVPGAPKRAERCDFITASFELFVRIPCVIALGFHCELICDVNDEFPLRLPRATLSPTGRSYRYLIMLEADALDTSTLEGSAD